MSGQLFLFPRDELGEPGHTESATSYEPRSRSPSIPAPVTNKGKEPATVTTDSAMRDLVAAADFLPIDNTLQLLEIHNEYWRDVTAGCRWLASTWPMPFLNVSLHRDSRLSYSPRRNEENGTCSEWKFQGHDASYAYSLFCL